MRYCDQLPVRSVQEHLAVLGVRGHVSAFQNFLRRVLTALPAAAAEAYGIDLRLLRAIRRRLHLPLQPINPVKTMNPKKRPLDLDSPPPSVTRLIFINPLSKGRVGKTTFYEYFASALNRNGIGWQGGNLDDRHEAFQERHPARVKNFHGEEGTAVDEYLPLFTAARRCEAPYTSSTSVRRPTGLS